MNDEKWLRVVDLLLDALDHEQAQRAAVGRHGGCVRCQQPFRDGEAFVWDATGNGHLHRRCPQRKEEATKSTREPRAYPEDLYNKATRQTGICLECAEKVTEGQLFLPVARLLSVHSGCFPTWAQHRKADAVVGVCEDDHQPWPCTAIRTYFERSGRNAPDRYDQIDTHRRVVALDHEVSK